MRQTFLFLIVFLAMACGSAEGANWVFLTSDDSHNIYFDRDGISHTDDGFTKVWSKKECTRNEGCRIPAGRYAKANSVVRISCGKKTWGVELTTYYDDRDIVVQDSYVPVPEMKPVAPDTINDTLLNFVCPGNNR